MENYSCKICGYPHSKKKKRFEDYFFKSKEDIIKHIEKEHKEVLD